VQHNFIFNNGKKEKQTTDFSTVQQHDDIRRYRCLVMAFD
jgi:hypothetical protein